MSEKIVIGDRDALKIRRQWEREILPKAESDQQVHSAVRAFFQRVSEGRLDDLIVQAKQPQPKRDKAEERRAWFEVWYHKLGFQISVPKPAVSNREFARREKLNQALFFRPATKDVSYDAFMIAVGQANHWTVTNQAERANIGWELIEQGYWFWTEISGDCPRLKTCWDDLSAQINLLSLEEYVIVWHAYKNETGKMLDIHIWTWLQTRFGRLGALVAGGYDGEVYVSRFGPEVLAIPCDVGGGRAAEVVRNAD